MKIYIADDYSSLSRRAANIISAQVITKPDSVLGLATGSSPIGTYKQLIDWYNKGDLDFAQVKTVNLDEYVGLSADNDQSYRYFMNKNLFSKVNIDPKNVIATIANRIEFIAIFCVLRLFFLKIYDIPASVLNAKANNVVSVKKNIAIATNPEPIPGNIESIAACVYPTP